MGRFEKTWGVTTTMERTPSPMADVGQATVTVASGDLWRVETDFHFLTLDSIVHRDFRRGLPARLMRYARSFANYVFSGAAFRMFAKSWRFGLYFLFPFAAGIATIAAAFLAGTVLARLAGVEGAGPTVAISLAVLWPLWTLVAKRTSVVHLMDLWSFSLDFLRGQRPDAAALLDRFASLISERSKDGGYDEILLVGHSTGGGLILDVAARALIIDPGLARRSPHVSLLTLGSTALKFGLHPAAVDFRKKAQSLVDEPSLQWAEFQCMTDPINFYKVDPVAAMGLVPRASGDPEPRPFPVIRRIHMRRMLDGAAYRRVRSNFLRVHYQFVMGNTRRYFYDFFMICFGPMPLATTAERRRFDPRLVGG